MSKLLEHRIFSHTQPTYKLANADAEKPEHFIVETFSALKTMT